MTTTEPQTSRELIQALMDDPDFLEMFRTALRSRAERPLFNMAGQRAGINPLATTGRVQVSPGQTISSASFGNPVWDQSINCFNSAADRDAQWPTPHDGSVCYTVDTQTLWVRRSGVWYNSTQPRFGARYSRNAALTSPSTANTAQAISWDTSVYDQAAAVSGGVYRCPAPGRYLVRTSASGSMTSGVLTVQLTKNGTTDTQVTNVASSTNPNIAQAVAMISCALNDAIGTSWATTLASVALRTGAAESYLAVDYLGPS